MCITVIIDNQILIVITLALSLVFLLILWWLKIFVTKWMDNYYRDKAEQRNLTRTQLNANRRLKKEAMAKLISVGEMGPATADILKSLSESPQAEESGFFTRLVDFVAQVKKLLTKS